MLTIDFVSDFRLSVDSVVCRGARLYRGEPRRERGAPMPHRKHRRRMSVAERRKGNQTFDLILVAILGLKQNDIDEGNFKLNL